MHSYHTLESETYSKVEKVKITTLTNRISVKVCENAFIPHASPQEDGSTFWNIHGTENDMLMRADRGRLHTAP